MTPRIDKSRKIPSPVAQPPIFFHNSSPPQKVFSLRGDAERVQFKFAHEFSGCAGMSENIVQAESFNLRGIFFSEFFDGDNLEMEKDWELMSELDKDEIIRKKIIREL